MLSLVSPCTQTIFYRFSEFTAAEKNAFVVYFDKIDQTISVFLHEQQKT